MSQSLTNAPTLFGDPSVVRVSPSQFTADPQPGPCSSRPRCRYSGDPSDAPPRPRQGPLPTRLGRGVYDALADAVHKDGWGGLYRGLIPNLVGGASSWGLYFLLYVPGARIEV